MTDRDLRNAIEFIPGKLYYVALSAAPSTHSQKHFFCIDNELVYWNFFLDFGPLNLGQLYRFSTVLNHKLADPRLKDKVIYYYSGSHPHRRANAAFLISAWAMLYMGKTPEEAFKPFKNVTTPFPSWHDATPTLCTFNLTIMDTLKGLYKARECRFFDFATFNVDEYEYFERVENGDLNWNVDGKFLAFAGPHATREISPGGYQTLTPENYVPYFKKKNVTLVVRLNKKYYDAKSFTNHGIEHIDMYFLDGSNPPDHILSKFIQRCEDTPGAVAVHCKAGLGRTGSCIGCYLMKHFRFTAEEIIGWLRITRPGMIIGPQQHWMKEMQPRMWMEGDMMRSRLKPIGAPGMDIENGLYAGEVDVTHLPVAGSKMGVNGSQRSLFGSNGSRMNGTSAINNGRVAASNGSSMRRQGKGTAIHDPTAVVTEAEEEAGASQGDALRRERQQRMANGQSSLPPADNHKLHENGRKTSLHAFLSGWSNK